VRRITGNSSRRAGEIRLGLSDCSLHGWSDCRSRSRSRLAQARLALDIPKMAFERILQVSCSAPEFSHDLPEIPRQFRQLFWPEYHQNYDENYDQVWNAEHRGLRAPLRLAVVAYTQRAF